jgi:hypothetical protein
VILDLNRLKYNSMGNTNQKIEPLWASGYTKDLTRFLGVIIPSQKSHKATI